MSNDKEKPTNYDFKKPAEEKTIDQQIEEKLIEQEKQRKEKEDIHILDIAKNLPETGYMKTDLKKAEILMKEDGKKITVLAMPLTDKPIYDTDIFVNKDGDKIKIYDTIFDIDLKQMFEGQVSDCASTIFPMLMDEEVQLALDEKKARTLEKRKEEFKWWWVLLLMMIMIPLILIIFTILPGLFGG